MFLESLEPGVQIEGIHSHDEHHHDDQEAQECHSCPHQDAQEHQEEAKDRGFWRRKACYQGERLLIKEFETVLTSS